MSPYGQSDLPGPSSDPGMPRGFVPTTPQARESGVPPPGFVPISPAAPEGAPLGFVPVMPTVSEGPPPGFFPASPIVREGAPPGFVPTSPVVPDGAPLGFVPISPVVPEGAPPGFIPLSPAGAEGAPPGFVPVSTTIPVNPLPSPSMSMTGALPVMARSAGGYSESHYNTTPRSRKVSFGREADSGWDSRPAWDDNRSDAYSPRLVRPPDISSRPVSPGLRRASRASFGGDPASVPIPPSVTPSIAYTGRSNSYNSSRRTTPGPGVARSASTRDESMRSPRMYPYAAPAGMPTPGAHSNPQLPGMPPVGLSSPYSRRLESYPDEEDRPLSPTESNFTLTTPPPASPARSVHSRLSAAASRASLFIPPDPVDAAAAVRPLGEFTDRDPSLRRSASRASMGSNRSYKKYDASEYVDPAMLASGQPSFLPEPTESKKSKKSKKSKGKR
ncbi:hypothetical protein DFH11DRAFT_1721980 [Phellopilus nigrolimitatus]|nr:hypothetical protein DFH11DRAFT_1721980 [Phellopilus nigrolimitatus]